MDTETTFLVEDLEAWRTSDGSLRFGRWIQIADDWHRIESDGDVMFDGVLIMNAKETTAGIERR